MTTHTTLAELTTAIHRSSSHTEIVTVHVANLAEALAELEQMIDSETQEIDHISRAWSDDEHDYHDVWCSPIGHDGMVWRLTLATGRSRTYETAEDRVVVSEFGPTYETYTRGTSDPLYRGDDEAAAAASLAMTDQQFAELLSSDPV